MEGGPVIESARLRLRPLALGDFEAVHALTLSDEMRRHLAHQPSREDSYRRLLASIGCWHLFGYGIFAALERDGGALVGTCGLFRMVRDLDSPWEDAPEAGWIIAQDRWRRGYAGEAMTAALDWFDGATGIARTLAMIGVGNTASEIVAARLGYVFTRADRHRGDPVNLYAREAPISRR
jgi:RimJ/RimL family protein N-acetyltransferase